MLLRPYDRVDAALAGAQPEVEAGVAMETDGAGVGQKVADTAAGGDDQLDGEDEDGYESVCACLIEINGRCFGDSLSTRVPFKHLRMSAHAFMHTYIDEVGRA